MAGWLAGHRLSHLPRMLNSQVIPELLLFRLKDDHKSHLSTPAKHMLVVYSQEEKMVLCACVGKLMWSDLLFIATCLNSNSLTHWRFLYMLWCIFENLLPLSKNASWGLSVWSMFMISSLISSSRFGVLHSVYTLQRCKTAYLKTSTTAFFSFSNVMQTVAKHACSSRAEPKTKMSPYFIKVLARKNTM